MLNQQLIRHCAPTLAGIKTANIFVYCFASGAALLDEIFDANQTLCAKGICVEILRLREGSALLLVYRRSKLLRCLARKEIWEFLEQYGYPRHSDIDGYLQRMKIRLRSDGAFPHEIGVFLDYPLEDVIGFIQNEGHNSKCSGCWKVYRDECEAQKLFARYHKCKEVYMKLFAQGRSIERLTVAA